LQFDAQRLDIVLLSDFSSVRICNEALGSGAALVCVVTQGDVNPLILAAKLVSAEPIDPI
jgi:hypothetical protein